MVLRASVHLDALKLVENYQIDETVEKRIFSVILHFCTYLLVEIAFFFSTTGHRSNYHPKHTSFFMYVV